MGTTLAQVVVEHVAILAFVPQIMAGVAPAPEPI